MKVCLNLTKTNIVLGVKNLVSSFFTCIALLDLVVLVQLAIPTSSLLLLPIVSMVLPLPVDTNLLAKRLFTIVFSMGISRVAIRLKP